MGDLQRENEQLKAQVAQLQQDFNAASRDAYILKAARERGIDPEKLATVAGDTPEQIEQNAERMRAGATGGFNGGTSPSPLPSKTTANDVDETLRRAAGYN
jgi:hypothetical protein